MNLKLKIIDIPWRLTPAYEKVTIQDSGRINLFGNKLANDYNFKDVQFFSIASNSEADSKDTSIYLMPNADSGKRVDVNFADAEGAKPYINIGKALDIFNIRYKDQVDYEIIEYEWEGDIMKVIRLRTVAKDKQLSLPTGGRVVGGSHIEQTSDPDEPVIVRKTRGPYKKHKPTKAAAKNNTKNPPSKRKS